MPYPSLTLPPTLLMQIFSCVALLVSSSCLMMVFWEVSDRLTPNQVSMSGIISSQIYRS